MHGLGSENIAFIDASMNPTYMMILQTYERDTFSVTSLSVAPAGLVTNGLEKNSSVESLDLSFKGLSYDSGETLKKLLTAPASALKTLVLSRNELGDSAVASLLEGNATKRVCVSNTVCLQSLDLGQTSLSAAIVPHLRHSLTHLSTLVLSANALGSAGGVALGSALTTPMSDLPCTLEVLELIDCGLAEGVDAILRAVPCCSKLRKLYLAGNNIPAASCEVIKDMILATSALQVLSLRANASIADSGASVIACAMQQVAGVSGVQSFDYVDEALFKKYT